MQNLQGRWLARLQGLQSSLETRKPRGHRRIDSLPDVRRTGLAFPEPGPRVPRLLRVRILLVSEGESDQSSFASAPGKGPGSAGEAEGRANRSPRHHSL